MATENKQISISEVHYGKKVMHGPPCLRGPLAPSCLERSLAEPVRRLLGARCRSEVPSPRRKIIQGDPEVVSWRPGAPRPKTTPFPKTNVCLALPPKAARPKIHSFPKQVCLFGPGTPGLQKTTWPKNHFGMPLTCIGPLRFKGYARSALPPGPAGPLVP